MSANKRLQELSKQGVAVWLDDLSRQRIQSGGLAKLAKEMSVVGVTTNPTIFQGAISKSDLYDEQVIECKLLGMTIDETVRMLTTHDVREACDILRPAADSSNGRDGRVSIEVDPRRAHDTDATNAEARTLWWMVNRPNLFIKIPATVECLPAITTTIARGISVNVTLIFSIERYKAVMEAYLTGLEQRIADGGSLDGLESVASFFVSRVDTEVDNRLDAIGSDDAKAARGKAGLANAQLAYQAYEEVISSDRWKALAAKGAHVQRPLWASTGVKNPDYPDTMYISDLVAPDTVNTMPEKTMNAYADHGKLGTPVTQTYDEAAATMKQLAALGVDYDDVVKSLEDEGLEKFEKSWHELLTSVKAEVDAK